MVSAWAGGGRQDFNFTFFCHFARPVSLILNFIAQKVRGGRKCRIENLLWLALYIHDLEVDGYYTVKYADATSFYKAMTRNSTDTVAAAIEAPQLLSDSNLNHEVTIQFSIPSLFVCTNMPIFSLFLCTEWLANSQ